MMLKRLVGHARKPRRTTRFSPRCTAALLLPLLSLGGIGLAACSSGGATSTASLTSSIAPLTRATDPSTSAAAASASDIVGHEVSSIPTSGSVPSDPKQQALVTALNAAGIKTDGVLDLVMSIVNQYCTNGPNQIVDAIIGQLVTQGYSSLDYTQALQAFQDAVNRNYCTPTTTASATPVASSSSAAAVQ